MLIALSELVRGILIIKKNHSDPSTVSSLNIKHIIFQNVRSDTLQYAQCDRFNIEYGTYL